MSRIPPPSPGAATLSINAVDLGWPWILWLNLQELRSGPALRGSDVLIPGVAGVRPRRRRVAAFAPTLNGYLAGDVDHAGAAYDTFAEGLYSNINYLRAHVVDPPTTGDGTRTCVFTDSTGVDVTAPVHVLGFRLGDPAGPGLMPFSLELSFPGGAI